MSGYSEMPPVVVIGGGIAGLSCCRRLHEAQVPFLLLEASDAVGGRVRTDVVDGFLLDRGFQVLLTAYPEPRSVLDFGAMKLGRFVPGAYVRLGGRFHRLADPWRRPWAGLRSLATPIGTLGDKLKVARLRRESRRGDYERPFTGPDTSTAEALEGYGFGSQIREAFFRPFFGGIFLDPRLETSSRLMHFVFRMFAEGDAALPAAGIQAIPNQLAASLPADAIRLRTRVRSLRREEVTLDDGSTLAARAIVVAAAARESSRLLGCPFDESSTRAVRCLYFAAERSPMAEPILVLNGEGQGIINNLCVPSLVSPTYAPDSRALISVTVLGEHDDDQHVIRRVREELAGWYGPTVERWRFLRQYLIRDALPKQPPGVDRPIYPALPSEGVFACGDQITWGSLHFAMVSGRETAEAVQRYVSREAVAT